MTNVSRVANLKSGEENSFIHEAWKIPLRLRNLFLLKTSSKLKDVAGTPFQEIGTRGRCRLLKFSPPKGIDKSKKSLLIIPSLINRYYILDLYSGCSLVESLTDFGHTVYVLDWGSPRPQDRYATLEDHILGLMDWAVEKVCSIENQSSIPIFGQCIGGTFATVYAASFPQKVSGLSLLTAPIDFSKEGHFFHWANKANVNLEEMANVWGNIRHEFLDQTFKLLQPTGDIRKIQNLFKLCWNNDFIRKYAAINKWLDDNINFPGKTYKKFIEDFYQKNLLIKGELELDGKRIELKKISCPLLCFYAKGDIIVPASSATAISEYISSETFESIGLGGGHIGCLISDKHQKTLWKNLNTWLRDIKNNENKESDDDHRISA